MKNIIAGILGILLISGCGYREREMELDKRKSELDQREQELILKEKTLSLKEQELAKKQKLFDSTVAKNPTDSFVSLHPQIFGKWNVNMLCTATTCSGSAIGDTKNEQWEIGYQNRTIVIQAFSDNKLVRVYTGKYTGNQLELSTAPDNPDPTQSTRMIVRIQNIGEKEMRGEREIIRVDNCHIVYSLDMKKV